MSIGTALVLTISDSASAGKRDDLSGPEARRILTDAGFEVQSIEILPDDRSSIESRLRSASAEGFQNVAGLGWDPARGASHGNHPPDSARELNVVRYSTHINHQ